MVFIILLLSCSEKKDFKHKEQRVISVVSDSVSLPVLNESGNRNANADDLSTKKLINLDVVHEPKIIEQNFQQSLISSINPDASNEKVLYDSLLLFPSNRKDILNKANDGKFNIDFKELLRLCFAGKNVELLELILNRKQDLKKDLDVFVIALENFDNSTFALLDKLEDPNYINYSDLVEHLLNKGSELAFTNYIDFLLQSYGDDDNKLTSGKLMCHKDCLSCADAKRENSKKSKNEPKDVCAKKIKKIELLQSKVNFWEILFLKSLGEKDFCLPSKMNGVTLDENYNPLHIIVDLNAPLSKKIELFEKGFILPRSDSQKDEKNTYNSSYINIAEPYDEPPISRLVNSASLDDEEDLLILINKLHNIRPDMAGKTGSKPCLMQRVIEKQFWRLADKCLDILETILAKNGIKKNHVLNETQGSMLVIDYNNPKVLSPTLLNGIEHYKQVESEKKQQADEYLSTNPIKSLAVPLLHALCYYGQLDLIKKAIKIGFNPEQVLEVCGKSSVGKDLEIYPRDMVRDNDPCKSAILEVLSKKK